MTDDWRTNVAAVLPPYGDWFWDGQRWVLVDEDALADECP
jgi:hypothetical protein